MDPMCPFCFSKNHLPSYLPDTYFNKKNFSYIRCTACNLIYLDPFPQPDDYLAMYPTSYQDGIDPTIIPDNKKQPGLRFSYDKHYELIKKYAPGKKLLDYGCGKANFLINVNHKGYSCDGAEYNPIYVKLLEKEIPGSHFTTIEDLLNSRGSAYDVIRLSNVLEHLDQPAEIVKKLKGKLNPGGILLIEGPIETNPSLAQGVRKLYFQLSKKLRKNKKATHPPTHIFFANKKNQREFFKSLSLGELYFEITECEWPFPETLNEAQSAGGFLKWTIAKTSKALSKLNPSWGNTFIYVGRPL